MKYSKRTQHRAERTKGEQTKTRAFMALHGCEVQRRETAPVGSGVDVSSILHQQPARGNFATGAVGIVPERQKGRGCVWRASEDVRETERAREEEQGEGAGSGEKTLGQ